MVSVCDDWDYGSGLFDSLEGSMNEHLKILSSFLVFSALAALIIWIAQ